MKKINFFLSKMFIFAFLYSFMITPIFASAAESSDYRDVDTTQKVYDYADLLTDDEEQFFKEKINTLIDKNNYDVFVVTIDYNDVSYATSDQSLSFLEDFGDFNNFGIIDGSSEDNLNYVALLLDEDNGVVSLDVKGKTCFGIYTDARQNIILDAVFEYYADYDSYGTINEFLKYVEKYGTDNLHEEIYDEDGSVVYKNTDPITIVLTILKGMAIGAVLSIILTFIIWKKDHKTANIATDAKEYIDKNNINITRSDDVFVRQYETRHKVNTSSSSGGHRGGTHTHRSSSGSRHSGGSRRR